MSYTRGENYIWHGAGDRVHLWIGDGADNWAECVWNEGNRHPDPGGVAVPRAVMDEFVVMRFAEFVREREVGPVIDRALANHTGNGECVALNQLAGKLKQLTE